MCVCVCGGGSCGFEFAFVHLQKQTSFPVLSAVCGQFVHGGKLCAPLSPLHTLKGIFLFNPFTIVCFHEKVYKKNVKQVLINRIYLSFSSLTQKHDFSDEIVFDFIITYENVGHNNNAFVCSNVRAGTSSQRGFILLHFFADLGFIYLNHRPFIYRDIHLYFFNIKKPLNCFIDYNYQQICALFP